MNQTTYYSFAAKWLKLLILMLIPSFIFSLLANDTVVSMFPFLGSFGYIGASLCNFAYGFILIKLGSEFDYYKTAGICSICSSLISLITTLINIESVLITLITGIISIVAVFYELSAHSDIVANVDHDLHVKWENLRLWSIISYAALPVCTVTSIILPLISLLIMLAALIGVLVTGIMKYVNLYKTSKMFNKLLEEENVSRETF